MTILFQRRHPSRLEFRRKWMQRKLNYLILVLGGFVKYNPAFVDVDGSGLSAVADSSACWVFRAGHALGRAHPWALSAMLLRRRSRRAPITGNPTIRATARVIVFFTSL
jgi:hypothetical protein